MTEPKMPVEMEALCPELQGALKTLVGHIKTCPKCRAVLAGVGLRQLLPDILFWNNLINEVERAKELLDLATENK